MKRGILTTLAILLAGMVALYSCDNISDQGIEESLDTVPNLVPVDGAQNVTATVERGSNSYFNINLSGVGENDFIREGITEAWCIDYRTPIDSDGSVHSGLKIYNTKGDKTFESINKLFLIKNHLMDQYEEITYREIQVAIWSLLEYPKFDMDNISTNDVPSRMVSNGQFNFDQSMVKRIVKTVKEGARVQSMQRTAELDVTAEDIEYLLEGVCVVETPADQQTVIVPCGETLWAWGQNSFRQLDLSDKWGYVYQFDTNEGNTAETPLIAGGGFDKEGEMDPEVDQQLMDHIVGDLHLELDGDYLNVTYEMHVPMLLNDIHFWVGCTTMDDDHFPGVPPGQLSKAETGYEFNDEDGPMDEHSFSVDISSLGNCAAFTGEDDAEEGLFHIMAHAGELFIDYDEVELAELD